MRPDKRSLSFTWMKGQQKHEKLENPEEEEPAGDNDNNKEQSSSSGEGNSDGWGLGRGSSGSRLRRLSHSLVRLRPGGGGAGDGDGWKKIEEEPISLEEEDMEDVEEAVIPDLVPAARRKVPFQSRENEGEVAVAVAAAAGSPQPESGGTLSISKRLNKTVQGVKASFGNWSQRFRKSTRRRYRAPSTPGSAKSSPAARKILGRTPTKLYSPFGIESPVTVKTPKRLTDRPATPRMARKSIVSSMVYSPSNNFRRDLNEVAMGMNEFHILSRDITRRSVRF